MSTWMLTSLRANAEQTTLYKHVKKSYIDRGDLLTLALFDCSFQWFKGGFIRLKRFVNDYAQGDISSKSMHGGVVALCTIASDYMRTSLVTSNIFEAGSATIFAYDALNVLDAEFHLLLGGLTSEQEEAALAEHSVWSDARATFMGAKVPESVPLHASPAEPLPASPAEPLPASPPESPPEPPASEPPAYKLAETESETPRTLPSPAIAPEQGHKPERPPYNNYHWPSPLARMIAKELGIAGKRCTHAQALTLLTKHWRLPDVATLLATSRQEIINKHYYDFNLYSTSRISSISRVRWLLFNGRRFRHKYY
jgi:hypothetical protein